MFNGIKMKKSIVELGLNGRLNVYVDHKKFTLTLVFKSIFQNRLGIFG